MTVVSAPGSLGFFGLPLPGTLRMASMTDLSYTAVGPAYDTGFIPATRRRIFTAGCPKPSISDISRMVRPSTFILSESTRKKAEKSIAFGIFRLT